MELHVHVEEEGGSEMGRGGEGKGREGRGGEGRGREGRGGEGSSLESPCFSCPGHPTILQNTRAVTNVIASYSYSDVEELESNNVVCQAINEHGESQCTYS